VGRGGEKLQYALDAVGLDVERAVGADFGCNIGGFIDCLLQRGAVRVYAVDTGYGMLEWKLRQDERVVVMERTNAMHVDLPEPVDIVTIDVGWTCQRYILPNSLKQVKPDGHVLSLLKPQYEAPEDWVRGGILIDGKFEEVIERTMDELAGMGIVVREVVRLPRERAGKNPEAFFHTAAEDCEFGEA
jgi:23S rRNA (cytidine1920-2'-O)/16S rRNA (cytidine1409-2'-O)-methyltransferase